MFSRRTRPVLLGLIALTLFARTPIADAQPRTSEPSWEVPMSPLVEPVVAGSTIVIGLTNGQISAYEADSGAMRWDVDDLSDPVAEDRVVYADRMHSPDDGASSLVAVDIRDGRELWSKPDVGGTLAADDTGVVVGNTGGIARYASDGTRRWMYRDAGFSPNRIALSERFVVVLGEREGAVLSGEIETLDRRNGTRIGTAPFGALVDLEAQTAYGSPDSPDDSSTPCGSSDLLEVSLGAAVSDDPNVTPTLRQRQADYILEDFPTPTPPPPGAPFVESPCVGDRNAQPRVVLDGSVVVLASGSMLGLFDRVRPQPSAPLVTPFVRYRDTTFVGGPYAGKIFVSRPDGLYAITIADRHAAHLERLITGRGKSFTVAGLENRLYASNGTTTIAFDATTLAKRAAIRLGCAHLRALVATKRSHVLACKRDAYTGLIVGLPR